MTSFGVSPITNKIFMGKTRPMKGVEGVSELVGKKTDVTDEVVSVVFEWFMHHMPKDSPKGVYEVSFDGCDYVLQMVRKKPKEAP